MLPDATKFSHGVLPIDYTGARSTKSQQTCAASAKTHENNTMTTRLLTVPDEKEALSRAYVQAIAARAGFATATYDFDRDGVDMRIQAGGASRPAIELQLKATATLGNPHQGFFRYRLKRRNYDLLTIDVITPRALVVLDLPAERDQWVTVGVEELVLRRCAYWLDLSGENELSEQASTTVRIPERNLFDVEGLHHLMEQARRSNG